MSELPQNPELQADYLEQLMAGAAQRAAQEETAKKAKELEEKGIVTKAELSTVLREFGTQLTETITSSVAAKLDEVKKAAPAPAEATDEEEAAAAPVAKASRKGTVSGASDPREDNPVRYLIQKSRKGESLDDLDRALVWGLTFKGLAQGMSNEPIEGMDFADEYSL